MSSKNFIEFKEKKHKEMNKIVYKLWFIYSVSKLCRLAFRLFPSQRAEIIKIVNASGAPLSYIIRSYSIDRNFISIQCETITDIDMYSQQYNKLWNYKFLILNVKLDVLLTLFDTNL